MAGHERQRGTRPAGRTQLVVAVAAIALLPALVDCSASTAGTSATADDHDYSVDAFPQKSIADMIREARSPSPSPTAAPVTPPPTGSSPMLASAGSRQPVNLAPSAAGGAAAPAPAPGPAAANAAPAAPDDHDYSADAYPSVSLYDILSGRNKSNTQ